MPIVFNPALPPQEEPSGEAVFNITEVKFGEGYVGANGNGFNEKSETWPLTWAGTYAEITPIRDFFDTHKGYIAFYWTPPLGVQGLYRVKRYSLIPSSGDNAKLSAVLEQVFAP